MLFLNLIPFLIDCYYDTTISLIESPMPGQIIKTFNIELGRIRDLTTPDFLVFKKEITSLLESD